jgi:N-acetylglucosaminyldiphosphoundecaprenol N-acetyl-beta-D-mannosaminyltransferase
VKEKTVSTVDIVGIPASIIDISDALAVIQDWIAQKRRHYVCCTSAHGIIESRHDKRLREIHKNAGLVAPDGMPIVWLARSLGAKGMRRVYGPDLMVALTRLSATHGYRQFYYGGTEGIAEKLKDRLVETHPNLQIAGTICPPFRPLTTAEDEAVINTINSARPDVIWVGLSTPKQEYWMADHRARLEAPVIIGVGAAFDFLSGTKRQVPTWMQVSGLGWLFRLGSEPRRLWRRYAVIVPMFASLALQQLVKSKLYHAFSRRYRQELVSTSDRSS